MKRNKKIKVAIELDNMRFESTDGLKPCPFCGSDQVSHLSGAVAGTSMFICKGCGADVCFYGAEREPAASKAWNRRSDDNA